VKSRINRTNPRTTGDERLSQKPVVSDYRHIIWDWNGTLFDDVAACVAIINRMLGKRAMPCLTHDQYRKVFTFPVRDYYEILGFPFGDETFEQLSHEFVSSYEPTWSECALYPHTRRVLEHVRASGKSQSILSALQQNALVALVQMFDLAHFFEHIIGLDNVYAQSKVEQGRQLLNLISHEPAEVLLVGDTVHDVEVARAIGCACVLVAHGHQSKERLQQVGATVIESLDELC
jgi:phosphoglycolate phosphatase